MVTVLLGVLAPLFAASVSPAEADSGTNLVGLFRLTGGSCSGGRITGTYLQMILPSGTVNGPYMSNADSPCSDQSFTPLAPGTDGGLSTAGYQAAPSPAFDSSGNARANRITAPAQYYGTAFATATNPTDPQTSQSVPVPTVTLRGSTLTADLRAFSVSWNRQYFNQGAPKPDGSTPGNTRIATGTYDAATHHFTLDWASQVQGGPFDKFTGKWHFEGTFVPASSTTSGAGTGTTSSAVGAGTSGSTGSKQGRPAGHTSAPTAASGALPSGATGAAGLATAGTGGAGAAPTAAAPVTAAPGASAPKAVGAAQPLSATAAPSIQTVTQRQQEWKISTPLVAIAIAIAILALGAIILTRVLERRPGTGSRSA